MRVLKLSKRAKRGNHCSVCDSDLLNSNDITTPIRNYSTKQKVSCNEYYKKIRVVVSAFEAWKSKFVILRDRIPTEPRRSAEQMIGMGGYTT